VYIGRAPCGEAGKDILLSRPTSLREEEGIDVSIITQVLELILAKRTADGTAIFEAYGDQHRKLVAPDEITMLCVDLSSSMQNRCDFEDVQANEDTIAQLSRGTETDVQTATRLAVENPAFHLPNSDDLKEYLKAHESYDDILAIVRTGKDDYQRRLNAEKVLQIIQQIDEQQIEAKIKRLDNLRRRSSHYHFKTQADIIERDVSTIRNQSLRMQKHKNLICAWLLASVGQDEASADPLSWKPGDSIPEVRKAQQQTTTAKLEFEIPREHCCHISSEIMDDPVITVDNYTYERKNIERW
jgi:3-methyladenine DNA glycosylase AlkC